jgi:hypothetical protein
LAGFKFRRQEPVGARIVDFLCAEKKLAVELDGSGHAYPIRQLGDAERTIELHENGIRVMRFWNSEVLQDLDWVLEAILLKLDPEKSRWARVDPHLNPLPQGEEGRTPMRGFRRLDSPVALDPLPEGEEDAKRQVRG